MSWIEDAIKQGLEVLAVNHAEQQEAGRRDEVEKGAAHRFLVSSCGGNP